MLFGVRYCGCNVGALREGGGGFLGGFFCELLPSNNAGGIKEVISPTYHHISPKFDLGEGFYHVCYFSQRQARHFFFLSKGFITKLMKLIT